MIDRAGGIQRLLGPTIAAVLLSLSILGCQQQPSGNPFGPTGSSTPTPTPTPAPSLTPTPIPLVTIEGQIVIKLEVGADVGAGAPVHLLSFDELERAALKESDAVREELDRRLEKRTNLEAREAALRDESVVAVFGLMEAYHKAWSSGYKKLVAEHDGQSQYLSLLDVAIVDAQKPVGDKPGPLFYLTTTPVPPNDLSDVRSSFEALRADVNRMGQRWREEGAGEIDRARKELQEEEKKFNEVYRFRDATRKSSQDRMDGMRRRTEDNPRLALGKLVDEIEIGLQVQRERVQLVLAKAEIEMAEKVRPALDEIEAWLGQEYVRKVYDAFVRAMKAAKVDTTHANDQGRFRFTANPGRYALYADYTDTKTKEAFRWLLAVRDGDNILSSFNATGTPESIAAFPQVRRLFYAYEPIAAATSPTSAPTPEPAPEVTPEPAAATDHQTSGSVVPQ